MKRSKILLCTLFAGLTLVLGFAQAISPASADTMEVRYFTAEVGSGKYHPETWVPGDTETTLVVNFTVDGLFDIQDAYVFTAPVTINGETVPTYIPEGEIAPHFTYEKEVTAGEVLTITITANPPGSELGIWYEYIEEVIPPAEFMAFLPVVANPNVLHPSPNQYLIQQSWPSAEPNEERCMTVFFSDATQDALLESGWFFGDMLYAELNGNEIDVPFTIGTGGNASQIGTASLPSPAYLTVCANGPGQGREIGLRIWYPAP